jgi:hypothetical protein
VNEQGGLQWLEQAAGVLLMALVLLDVFLTVLYARANTGIISPRLSIAVWWIFKTVSKPFGQFRAKFLSFTGPMILVSYVLVWALLLATGAALIIHPKLGTSVRANSGATKQDFMTAMFAGGSSLSIVGASNFSPQTDSFRIIYLFNSLIGVSVTSLTLTYLMQVYSALHRRNTVGLNLHLASAETADAAELIAGLGPEGQFNTSYSSLAELASDVSWSKESHHFYPVLLYFRFPEVYYSVSRCTLISLDTVSLIKSALSDEKYRWLKESAAVEHLWSGARLLLETIADTSLEYDPNESRPDSETLTLWRRRYFAALRRLRQAGIEIIEDEQAGADIYLNLRGQWCGYITELAPRLGYSLADIDPVGSRPESSDERKEFRARVHSAASMN